MRCMQKYSTPLLARLGELLDSDRHHRLISISTTDLLSWCLIAHEQADGARHARHRHRARWLRRDVLAAYGRAGYVPIEGKYFVAGLRDAVGLLQRELLTSAARAEA